MYARVLFTDGTNALTVYWLQHTGRDVYHGWHPNQKGSYHESGQTHYKTRSNEISDVEIHTPLAQLQGAHVLGGLQLINHPGNFTGQMAEERKYKPQWKRSASDAILMIDSRSIELDANIKLTIGLLEPGNFAALNNCVYKYVHGDVNPFNTKQILLSTSVEPWVWVKVDVVTQDETREALAVWFPPEDISNSQG